MGKRIEFTLNYDENVEQYVKQHFPEVLDYHILSQSLDARGSNRGKAPSYHYILEVKTKDIDFESREEVFSSLGALKNKPIIIGAGPAGLFCALRLAEYGIPSIILERGESANKRMLAISRYWKLGEMDEDNNVCYGEGGAGLFSDGKLITRVKSPYVQYVMNKFVEFGAPKETAYISNPHLGSNKIRTIITKITDYLKHKGCEIYYNECVDDFLVQNKKIISVKTKSGKTFAGDHFILATGHSAKNIYQLLTKYKVSLEAKDFAVGIRIEHPREYIDRLQYGQFCETGILGAARYRLSYHNEANQKGTYSFCMCPGGYVLSSGTEADGIVVNGMSNFARNSYWSNSALVVSVKKGVDFNPDSDQLGGLRFQTQIEKKAFNVSSAKAHGRELPAMTLKEFMDNRLSKEALPKSSSPSGIFKTNLHEILPRFVSENLQKALSEFDKKLKGYAWDKALLLAPETRTSAPVTVHRDLQDYFSTSHQNLYPCGEGAGHAGGITSAAVDGIKVAMAIIKKEKSIEFDKEKVD